MIVTLIQSMNLNGTNGDDAPTDALHQDHGCGSGRAQTSGSSEWGWTGPPPGAYLFMGPSPFPRVSWFDLLPGHWRCWPWISECPPSHDHPPAISGCDSGTRALNSEGEWRRNRGLYLLLFQTFPANILCQFHTGHWGLHIGAGSPPMGEEFLGSSCR